MARNTQQLSQIQGEEDLFVARLMRVAREEISPLNLRMLFLRGITALLPYYVGTRLRGLAMRLVGIDVGRGTVVCGMPRLYGSGPIHHRLHIGSRVMLNIGCVFDLSDTISIGSNASLGHEVMVLTNSHQIGSSEHRAGDLQSAPVSIGTGAWIGARALLLPGVKVGNGSIVAAGSVVVKDVPPNTLVAGVPARIIRELPTA